MKLYLTTWVDDDPQGGLPSNQSRYTGTQADFKSLEKTLKCEFLRHIKTREVEVPTDKAGLIQYLNTNIGIPL